MEELRNKNVKHLYIDKLIRYVQHIAEWKDVVPVVIKRERISQIIGDDEFEGLPDKKRKTWLFITILYHQMIRRSVVRILNFWTRYRRSLRVGLESTSHSEWSMEQTPMNWHKKLCKLQSWRLKKRQGMRWLMHLPKLWSATINHFTKYWTSIAKKKHTTCRRWLNSLRRCRSVRGCWRQSKDVDWHRIRKGKWHHTQNQCPF